MKSSILFPTLLLIALFGLSACDSSFPEQRDTIFQESIDSPPSLPPEQSEESELPDDSTIEEPQPPEEPESPEEPPVEEQTWDGFETPLDEGFDLLPQGRRLSDIRVKGSRLYPAKGRGHSFTSSKELAYKKLKEATLSDPKHKVQWTLMDLTRHKIIARSLSAGKKIFGASSSKIYVAAALLDLQDGDISKSQLQTMSDMLVVSSNSAWSKLQKEEVGGGSDNRGRQRIHNFTQSMGYKLTRGFKGYLGDLHGNELTPDELVETLFDTYTGAFPGAEYLWKIMYTCRTGSKKGERYIPKDIFVGGKTGTYSGATENPETGEQYNVRVRNHVLTFNVKGSQYGLAVLANDGKNESSALLAGGLIREYTGLE